MSWADDTNYSGGPASGQPTKVEPSDAERSQGCVAGEPVLVQHINFLLNELDACDGIFGTGADGDVVIGAGVTTLTRDMYYDDLTIQASGDLVTAGYRVFVRGLLLVQNNGEIYNDGDSGGNAAASTGGSAGTGAPPGSLAAGADGAAGVTGGAGANGNTSTNAAGGTGGNAGTGGTGGVATAPIAANGGIFDALVWRNAITPDGTPIRGGGGGGSGTAAGGTAASGGAGGGGGILLIAAKHVRVEAGGEIHANGGNAGTSFAGGGSAAGSGGGGPGRVVILCRSIVNDGTIECEGGTGAAEAGGGGAGSTPVGTTPLILRV